MKFSLLPLVFFVLTIVRPESSEGYRILGVFPLQMKSHFIIFEALMKGLARKGHQVDIVSGYPLKKPHANYTDVVVLPPPPTKFADSITYEVIATNLSDTTRYVAVQVGNVACEHLGHPGVMNIIKHPPTDPPYDLVITQVLCTSCFMALGHVLKVPVVGVSASALYPWSHGLVTNPPNLAFVPDNLLNYVAPMTFWQRLHNTIHAVYSDLSYRYFTRTQYDIMKKYLGEDAPSISEAERNVALILINSHPSINGPKPFTPAVVEVGGLHIENADHDLSQLDSDLKHWMDDSKEGFIYMSFGTLLVVESFPKEMIQVIYKSLGKIAPTRVLMKTPNPQLLPPGLPKNFRTIKWAPQLQVLKHKNIKAFVTHGGLLGSQEAIHCAVPMIGIPFIVDQFVNVDQYSKMNIAVPLKTFTEQALDEALNEILYNPVYKDTMKQVSAKFLDRPMSAMETATWWVEYAVRHGSEVLRSPAMDLYWWQLQLLDVYVFILLSTSVIVYITIILVRFLVKRLFVTMSFRIGRKQKVA